MGFLNNELNHKQQSGDFVKMIKQFFLAMMVCIVSLSQTGCGLSIVQDWQASGGKAITGGGAIAGKDYVSGLKPSENARKYFAKISANDDTPIETIRRTDDSPSKTGVRFVKNGGILIPPGVTISFTNRGYCMDPHLPAPKAGEEFQLVPVTQLIPEDLQGIYKKLVTKASSGDPSVQRNMQHLIWALRTAGTDAAFANNLTPQQKRILDRCSEYPGQFEEFNANAKANSKALKELIGLADSFLNVKIGNVSYKASDLLDPDVGSKKINEHINQLIGMSQHLPVEKSGFNFGEIQPGIYTDVQGTGPLQYRAKIANASSREIIFYPANYVGQVGSGTKSQKLTFFANADSSQRQRVTGSNKDEVDVIARNGQCNYANFNKVFTDNEMKHYDNISDAENALKRELQKALNKKNECVAVIYEERNSRGRVTGYKVSSAVDTGSECGFVDNSSYNPKNDFRSYRKVAIGHTHGQPDKNYGNPYIPSEDDKQGKTPCYLLNPDGVWGNVSDPGVNWDPKGKGRKYE